jgi:hypothetical protein
MWGGYVGGWVDGGGTRAEKRNEKWEIRSVHVKRTMSNEREVVNNLPPSVPTVVAAVVVSPSWPSSPRPKDNADADRSLTTLLKLLLLPVPTAAYCGWSARRGWWVMVAGALRPSLRVK